MRILTAAIVGLGLVAAAPAAFANDTDSMYDFMNKDHASIQHTSAVTPAPEQGAAAAQPAAHQPQTKRHKKPANTSQ